MIQEYDFAPAIAACFDYDSTLDRVGLEAAIRKLFVPSQQPPFAPAIAACFDYDSTLDRVGLEAAIRKFFDPPETRESLLEIHTWLEQFTGGRKIALVYGGATKIKEYVFEAPKLPEIRGASALLDWVNEQGLMQLWHEQLDVALGDSKHVEQCSIYASGGNFLAFAPAHLCADRKLPDLVEQLYTRQTLTALSASVSIECSLLELRFGRDPLRYWIEDFERDCAISQRSKLLLSYYYPPEGVNPKDSSAEALQRRFFNRKTFNELVTILNTMFYRRREERQREQAPFLRQLRDLPRYEMIPWSQKCATSDIRSAVVSAPDLPNQPLLSESSARKSYVGRKLKRKEQEYSWFTRAFTWKLSPLPDTWEDKFCEHVRDSPYAAKWQKQHIQSAQDVGEIGQVSHPKRYIGMIYADGNNVARYMGTTKHPGEFAQHAQKLTNAAKQAVFSALAQHLQPAEIINDQGVRESIYPFEILTIGGDDMILIVPGSKALDIALAMGLAFEQLMGASTPRPPICDRYRGTLDAVHTRYTPNVGLSAGVVIAQENLPIFFLHRLVEQLLKSAKKLAHTRSHAKVDSGGAIDFMVLKSITMITDRISTFREQALGDDTFREQALGDDEPPNRKTYRRTARPYTWHEIDGLLHTVRALQDVRFPRSQLYRLRGVLDSAEEGGPLVSSLEYLATRSRLTKYADTLLEHVEGPWQSVDTPPGVPASIPPWLRMQKGNQESIWPDLAEIYEFVERDSLREESAHA